jgi:hypothetical protein
MTTNGRSWGAANKDFVVAHRLFTYHLEITNDKEREHYADIVKEYPPGTPVMGWADERWADDLLMQLGYFMVPYISVENLTVQSSFPSTTGKQSAPKPAEVDDNSVYIAFYVADGDNLLHTLVYEPDTIMTTQHLGQIPTTWVINPGIVDLAPRLFDWYQARMSTGDQELSAQIGDGHPGSDRYSGFSFYCDLTRRYLERAGIHTLKQMAETEAVAWNIRPYAINSGYAGTEYRGVKPYEYHLDGETFHIGSIPLEDDVANIREIVRNAPKSQPLFLNIFSGTASGDAPRRIKEAADALKSVEDQDGRRYVFLRTMDLAATYKEWRGE